MIADKIIKLRKKNGWSQEELAEKMNVSRQAVSKWEGAQSVPDLEKILQLSILFGVTTDYLLKDEIEIEEYCDAPASKHRQITMEEAHAYLDQRRRASHKIALATFFCILSPITLILLGAASEEPRFGITEALAGALGFFALFFFVVCAIPLYVYCGLKNAPYEFLEKNVPFELGCGVRATVESRLRSFNKPYVRTNIIAVCLCVISPLPLILSAFTGDDFLCVTMLAVTMITAGIGAVLFITVGVQNASMQKLLQTGEFVPTEKASNAMAESIGGAYWGLVITAYLAWSFLSGDWHITWLLPALGGALFPAVVGICNAIFEGKKKP